MAAINMFSARLAAYHDGFNRDFYRLWQMSHFKAYMGEIPGVAALTGATWCPDKALAPHPGKP
ncbi:hypothetical protein C2U55_08425 [Enterobacteriaceae bacterium ENNIH3]|nr:hypothetical protein C2U55_08425 [Enterobacteriaceae bacterium ENNIH3]AUV05583.1 hypothetical protein C2U52_04440 [Enterobacteriaceae bacterium ENNIH2]PWF52415.1 hypothetical protein BHT19_0016375 [[Kluyvera] intestini]